MRVMVVLLIDKIYQMIIICRLYLGLYLYYLI